MFFVYLWAVVFSIGLACWGIFFIVRPRVVLYKTMKMLTRLFDVLGLKWAFDTVPEIRQIVLSRGMSIGRRKVFLTRFVGFVYIAMAFLVLGLMVYALSQR